MSEAVPGSRSPRVKRLFQRLDHAAIYLLIAGTYTPFTLVSLRGGWGWTLLVIVWGLAILGIVLEVAGNTRRFSVALHLAMGYADPGIRNKVVNDICNFIYILHPVVDEEYLASPFQFKANGIPYKPVLEVVEFRGNRLTVGRRR